MSSPGPEPGIEADAGELVSAWWRIAAALVVAGQSMAFSLAVNLTPPEGAAYWLVHGILIAAAAGVCALLLPPLAGECWRQLRRGRVTVEALFLVTLAGAFAASLIATLTRTGDVYYEVVSILLAIYGAGRTLGARSRAKALRAVDETRERFDRCWLLGPEGPREVAVSEVKPGDRVRVSAGGAIAVDGLVRGGRSLVVETALTGEWQPAARGPGDRVLAGTHTVDGDLEIEVESAPGGRRLDAVLAAVAAARLAPSRLQQQADRLAAGFLPVVLAVSLGTALYWTWREGWVVGLFNSMAVLLVACPCALGLATPLAVWQGLARLAGLGLVARTGDVLAVLADADVVCLDKTGTLSGDRLQVMSTALAPDFAGREAEVARWVAAAEEGEHHPVAAALRDWAQLRAHGAARLVARERRPTLGLVARVADNGGERRIVLGERALVPAVVDDAPPAPGRRVVHVAVDGRAAARLEIGETWRAGAAEVFPALRELGVATEVLTGDPAARDELGSGATWHRGLDPVGKLRRVEALAAEGRTVLFIGDGINDAAAMSAAHGAVAMNAGAQLAQASAPAVFLGTDLRFLPAAIRLARAVRSGVATNIRFAAGYNAIGMTIAASGWLHPVAAALLMLGSSAFVSWRALRASAVPDATAG